MSSTRVEKNGQEVEGELCTAESEEILLPPSGPVDTAAAFISNAPPISKEQKDKLVDNYSELVDLLSEFGTKVGAFKDCMESMTSVVPSQTRLTTIWEEQAKEWSRSEARMRPRGKKEEGSLSDEEDDRQEEGSVLFL